LKPGHAIWNGNIIFSSVAVPVKLHPAFREDRIQFHLLHRRDLVRLKRQMVCALDGAPVPVEDQARGFELEGGRYILVDPRDLEKAEPKPSRTIAVHEFVPAAQIDPVYFERSFYLEPVPHGDGYGALAVALAELRVDGICTWTMRKRAYVGALAADGRVLRLTVLRHAGEVVTQAALRLPAASLSARELKVGTELVDHMTGRFQPERFEDKHQERLRQMIDRKARGHKVKVVRPKQKAATKPDTLLKVLEAGLKKVA